MKRMRTMLIGAFALLFTSLVATPLIAAGDDFAGPYIAVQGSMHGAVMDGSATNSNSEVTTGTLGNVFGAAGLEVGYLMPGGDNVLIGLNIAYQPGDGKIAVDAGAGDSGSDTEDITIDIGDLITASIMPMFAVSDSSAFYISAGRELVDLEWSGDVQDTTLNSSMRADTLAVGSRTLIGTHAFVQTEFGYNDFGSMYVDTKISDSNATVSTENLYGSFTIGVKY